MTDHDGEKSRLQIDGLKAVNNARPVTMPGSAMGSTVTAKWRFCRKSLVATARQLQRP